MSFKKYATVINVIILALMVFLFLTYGSIRKEGFTPGMFPKDVDFPLLYQDYPLKQKIELSKTGSEVAFSEYPIYSASSLENNNIRYWKTPDNGKCSPAIFCDTLYDDKTAKHLELNKPEPEWDMGRVNYYLSSN